jgi:23S rRNA pseudouridine2605 synthase
MQERLSKIINKSGLCSRRDAEKLILDGKVYVNGKVIKEVVTFASLDDVITVEGKQINLEEKITRLWIYNKPVGLITTHRDTHGRQTVFENIKGLPRVISIGRLDKMSEGLLLLTNDGNLARKFELPSNKIERVYLVQAIGNHNAILSAKFPIEIDGIIYTPSKIVMKKNGWFEVTLISGKNREIRRIFGYFGLRVEKLIRIKYGPFVLGNLKPGEYFECKTKEI